MVTESIKIGYKQTEIGIIPVDWDLKTFGEVMDGFSSGQTPYRGNPEFYRGDIPWITSGELNYNIITDTIEKITPDGVKNRHLKLLPKGTFLFAITGLEAEGTRGACAITGIEATTNQSCMALYPKKGVLITKYLYYYYVKYGKGMALKYCQGTKQQSYNGRIVRTLPIIVPRDINEQEAISQLLTETDVLIHKLDELILKKKGIKRGIMQDILSGNKRLPGFNQKWDERELSQCGVITMGQSPPGGSYSTKEGVPLLNGAVDLKENGIFVTQFTTSPTRMSKKGDLLFCIRATIGNLQISDNEYCIGRGVAALSVDSKLDHNLISYKLQELFEQMRKQSQGGVIKGLRKDELAEFKVRIPRDPKEQEQIGQFISDVDAEIEELEAKRNKYTMIKDGMMQQLFTGKVRLKWK